MIAAESLYSKRVISSGPKSLHLGMKSLSQGSLPRKTESIGDHQGLLGDYWGAYSALLVWVGSP